MYCPGQKNKGNGCAFLSDGALDKQTITSYSGIISAW